MDIKAFLSKKVAGVPVSLIALLFAGGLLYMAIRMRPAPEPDATDLEDTPGGDLPDVSNPVFSATPVIYQPSGIPSVSSTPQEDSNELWKRRAIEWLVGNGESVNDASISIQKYLNGEILNAKQGAIRDKAVHEWGLPPEDLDAGRTKPPKNPGDYSGPPTAQGKAPTWHTVKGTTDNQPQELARLYYGTSSRDATLRIKSTNPSLRRGQPGGKKGHQWVYPIGTKVWIPEHYAPKRYRATSRTRGLYAIARKNGINAARVRAMNPGMKFPVKVGTRVRVR